MKICKNLIDFFKVQYCRRRQIIRLMKNEYSDQYGIHEKVKCDLVQPNVQGHCPVEQLKNGAQGQHNELQKLY